MYGSLAHYFDIQGEIPFRFNYGLMFIPIFLSLFVQAIFETKSLYKNRGIVLNNPEEKITGGPVPTSDRSLPELNLIEGLNS